MMEPSLTWPALSALVVVGVFAGAVNTIAGGGSLLGIPALIFFGLPANVANATNRIGVLLQSVTATAQFHREGVLQAKTALFLLIPTSLGALLGSWLSVDIDEQLFRQIIGGVMLVMLVVLMFKPHRWLQQQIESADSRPGILQMLGFFLIGGYGGFLQAGVGIFLLAALVLLAGRDLVHANAIKALLIAVFTLPALVVYFANDLLAWIPGLALAIGSSLGGYLGTKMTVSWGPAFVRWVLFVVIVVASSKLLGFW